MIQVLNKYVKEKVFPEVWKETSIASIPKQDPRIKAN